MKRVFGKWLEAQQSFRLGFALGGAWVWDGVGQGFLIDRSSFLAAPFKASPSRPEGELG